MSMLLNTDYLSFCFNIRNFQDHDPTLPLSTLIGCSVHRYDIMNCGSERISCEDVVIEINHEPNCVPSVEQLN